MNNKFLLSVFPVLLLSSCGFKSNSNVNSYDDLLKAARDNDDFHTELYVFPENTSKGTPTNFAYKSMEDLLTGSYFFYLVMTYDEANFNSELDRISKIVGHFYDDHTKSIIHYEEQSIYLTIDRDSRYEYVKYDKEKLEIAYVSNQLFSWNTARVELRHSLPSITIPSELDDGDNSYNMYYFYVDEPDGLGGYVHTGAYVIE